MPAGSEDRVAEIESEVHIVPALQVVFGERQADRSDGRVIDERGFGDVLHLFAGQPPVVAVHGIKSRAQEENWAADRKWASDRRPGRFSPGSRA